MGKTLLSASVHISALFQSLWQQLPYCYGLPPSTRHRNTLALIFIHRNNSQSSSALAHARPPALQTPQFMFSLLPVLYFTADQLCLESNLHEGKDNIGFASQCVQSQPSLEGGRAW